MKRVCSTEILLFILLYELAYLRGSIWGCVGVLQLGFQRHSLTIGENRFGLQATGGKEG